MANTQPQLIGDKWTLDVDPDDKVFYVFNVTQWLTDNSTSAVSFTLIPTGVTVISQADPQGDRGGLLAAKLQIASGFTGTASCTARVVTADGQQFDKTMYFNQVQN
jgi:hypothetical protein